MTGDILELALIIICNGLILAFMITGIISALSPGSQPEKQKRSRTDKGA